MKPSEQECKYCHGLGKIPRTDGQTMVCRACNGRGAILYDADAVRHDAMLVDATKRRAYQEMVNNLRDRGLKPEHVENMLGTSDYAPIPMPVIDPHGAQRRDFALKTAMAAFQMCNSWNGSGRMDWGDVIPFAREVERFLLGD